MCLERWTLHCRRCAQSAMGVEREQKMRVNPREVRHGSRQESERERCAISASKASTAKGPERLLLMTPIDVIG